MISIKLSLQQSPLKRKHKILQWSLWLCWAVFFFFTTGCVSLNDPETSQIHASEVVGILQAGGSASGQTLIASNPGLHSLEIWLGAENPRQQGSLIFRLLRSPEELTPIYQASFPTNEVGSKRVFHIAFPEQDDSQGKTYYFQLRAVGKNLQLYGRAEDIYPAGSFYLQGQPVEADIAFRTSYEYGWPLFAEDLSRWSRSASLIIPFTLLLVLPGWFLLNSSAGFGKADLGSKIALVLGLSMAVIPVVMLWTTELHLPWSSTALWVGMGLLVTLLFLQNLGVCKRWLRKISSRSAKYFTRFPQDHTNIFYGAALVAIFIISLITRLVMVRNFATPLWVDSVHHGLLTRLIFEQGGFPNSLAPYLTISPVEYHPGFHSLAASLIWLSGLEINQALLILGQVLNALTVFSSYLFTIVLLKDPRAALIAAAITGFFAPMPAYYTSWGRYTHLEGMLVMPVFYALFVQLLNHSGLPSKRNVPTISPVTAFWGWLRPVLLLSIGAAGLFLIHYRVAAFGLLLAVAHTIVHIRLQERSWWLNLVRVVIAVAGAFLVAYPWVSSLIQEVVLPQFAIAESKPPLFDGFFWQYLTTGYGTQALLLALFGLVLGGALRKRFSFILFVWLFFLFLLPNLSALGLPGGNWVNHTAVEISLYLPISVLGGYFLSQAIGVLFKFFPAPWTWATRSLVMLAAAVLILLGAQKITTILNPVTFLSRQPDLTAIHWIDEHIPDSEPVMINPFLWGYGNYAGSDGGFWISPLSGQRTLPPPVLYGVSSPQEVQQVNQLCEQVIANGNNPPGLWEVLRQNKIRYIYLGVRGGAISPAALETSDLFTLLYKQDGAWVFETSQNPLTDSPQPRIIP